MPEKLLHVACLVKDSNLWELLRSLETHKVGNVEVRPVAPAVLALPAPAKSKPSRKGTKIAKSGTVLKAVQGAIKLKQPFRVRELARSLGVKAQSTHSAVVNLMRKGVVKHTAPGLYVRIRPDKTGNGAHP